ncbi:probable G-protein coupled receptor 139 [Gigantopelta aegis]|uniref:probable G-protein coupled receptor 139 n=1 Tax=Gigantopelta aegis TaxID=1735272 RepID=UPI001B88AA8B|nr:probable G-protein coupled receptor 139 [Gigantopelta aegis]XP_041375922.1 probable G-protein coupled receptor 139 [Gigantopelta aegis]
MSCLNYTEMNKTSMMKSYEEVRTEEISHFFMAIATPLVCSFGVLGNILNLVVLTMEKYQRTLTKMELSAHMGLIALAFSDFMFCLLALLFTLLPLKDVYELEDYVVYYDWLGGGFITIFIVISTWLIVVMAGERYMAVCHPFKARKLISLRKTRISITVIFVLCALCTVPIFLEKEIVRCDNSTFLRVEDRKMFTRPIVAARRLAWSVCFDFIPCASLIYFNIILILKIRKAKQLRQNMAPLQREKKIAIRPAKRNGSVKFARELNIHHQSHSQSSSFSHSNVSGKLTVHLTRKRAADSALNSVTATLVAVVLLFLILVSPSELLKFVLEYATSSVDKYKVKLVRSVTNFMQALNFSTNFVLYCAINKSFRQTLTKIVCLWWIALLPKRKRKGSSDSMTSDERNNMI